MGVLRPQSSSRELESDRHGGKRKRERKRKGGNIKADRFHFRRGSFDRPVQAREKRKKISGVIPVYYFFTHSGGSLVSTS